MPLSFETRFALLRMRPEGEMADSPKLLIPSLGRLYAIFVPITLPLIRLMAGGSLAFMFETRFRQRVTKYAAELDSLQDNYIDCWTGLEKRFNPNKREPG